MTLPTPPVQGAVRGQNARGHRSGDVPTHTVERNLSGPSGASGSAVPGETASRHLKTAIYVRVSKGDFQDPETQLLELRQWAEGTGLSRYDVFVDEISSRDRRPQKEEVLRQLRVGLVSTVVVVRLDRWGRTMGELVSELDEFVRRGWTFISLREGLRFDSAAGRLYAHMLSAFANYERDLISERTAAGLIRARSQGKIGGRHPVGCGCGARPEGRPAHDGPVQLVRDGKQPVKWVWPDGRELLIQSNPLRPDGGSASPERPEGGQTSV